MAECASVGTGKTADGVEVGEGEADGTGAIAVEVEKAARAGVEVVVA